MPWSCPGCRLVNDTKAIKCSECGTARPADAVWACPMCTFVNDAGESVCGVCNTARDFSYPFIRPAPVAYPSGSPSGAPSGSASPPSSNFNGRAFIEARKAQTWKCPTCTLVNPSAAKFCDACGTGKPWICPLCTLENEPGAAACGACGTPKPAATGAKGGSLAKRRKTKRRKYTKRRRACRTRRIKKQNRS